MFDEWIVSNQLTPVFKPRLYRVIKAAKPYAMVSRKRMQNLNRLLRRALRGNVPGDVVEAGVARGGSAIVLATLVLQRTDDRHVWLYDAFEDAPDPAATFDEVHHTLFETFAFDRERVHLTKGLFEDVIAECPADRIALLHLDASGYEGNKACLDALYPKVSPRGWVIFDNYGHDESCRRAVDELLSAEGLRDALQHFDRTETFFQKPG